MSVCALSRGYLRSVEVRAFGIAKSFTLNLTESAYFMHWLAAAFAGG
jgi:hypothetical protein